MIPVAHTLFDSNALASHLGKMFDIGAIENCVLWRSFINDVYRLEADRRQWWFRIHPVGWRTRPETASEISAVLKIIEAGGTVARPVPRRDGDYILEIDAPEGLRVGALFEDAPGAELRYIGADGAANAYRYGVAAARLHDACDAVQLLPARDTMDTAFILREPSALIAHHLSAADKADMERITEHLLIILQDRNDLTVGFCHGDLNDSNIHFKGEVATAFDFDCCAWGWRAFELAAFARGIAWRSNPGETADTLISAYYAGYRSHRPIASSDLDVQPAMLVVQRIWVTALHLGNAPRWGAINFGRPYAARCVEWLRAWESTLKEPPIWTRLSK